ncbi:MAG: AAA family ATPase [Prevotella sp.]|nr:AAA family ATPase [Prevotella sp.]
MKEKKDPVNGALQHAGEPTVVTPELLALDKERVTSESEISDEEFLFKLNGVPCCPRGDLSTMTGPAKTGKTNVAAMLMACCANRRVLGFERIGEEPLKAMWFDTEQSRCTTKRILTDRIGGLLGGGLFPDEQFFVFNVRGHMPKERIEMLALAIKTYEPDICIIDGIADLLDDINSGPASVELMQRLLTIASVNKCNITAMIHLNRSGEKLNLRGWIGTVMVQKSYEVFNCDKVPKKQTFSIGLTFSRRYYLEDPMYYEYDESGLPIVTDEPEGARNGRKDGSAGKDENRSFNKEFTDEQASDAYLPWDFRKLFDTAMGGAASLGYDELEKRVMGLSGIRQKQYYYRVFDAAERQRVVKKVLDKSGRVAVIMLPC